MRWWHRWRGGMTTHRVVCPCGYDVPVDGWLDALGVSRHSRTPGCDAVVDLHYSREAS